MSINKQVEKSKVRIMNKMSNLEILGLIDKLQKSEAINYLESHERLFLSNISEKVQGNQDTVLNYTEVQNFNMICKKYLRYID